LEPCENSECGSNDKDNKLYDQPSSAKPSVAQQVHISNAAYQHESNPDRAENAERPLGSKDKQFRAVVGGLPVVLVKQPTGDDCREQNSDADNVNQQRNLIWCHAHSPDGK
jgi:hypothetical protein